MNTSAIIIALKCILDSDTIPANDRLEMVVRITEYDRKELDIHFGNKIGNDINPYLIRMFQAVQKG